MGVSIDEGIGRIVACMQVSRSGSLLELARRCGPEAARRSVTVHAIQFDACCCPFVIPGRHLPARATVLPPALHGITSRRSSLCGRIRERGFVGTFGAGARLGLYAYALRTAENLPCALHSQNISSKVLMRAGGGLLLDGAHATYSSGAKLAHADRKPAKRSLHSRHSSFIVALACQAAPRRPVDGAHPFDSDSPLPDTPIPCNTAASSPAWAAQVLILNCVAALGSAPCCGGAQLGLHAKRAKEKT